MSILLSRKNIVWRFFFFIQSEQKKITKEFLDFTSKIKKKLNNVYHCVSTKHHKATIFCLLLAQDVNLCLHYKAWKFFHWKKYTITTWQCSCMNLIKVVSQQFLTDYLRQYQIFIKNVIVITNCYYYYD